MNNKTLVGKIFAPHGLRGEFKLKLFEQQIYNAFKTIKIFDENDNIVPIKYIKNGPSAGVYICALNNIHDRNASEAFGKMNIYCDKETVSPWLNTDEYYCSDLAGKQVVDSDHRVIGIVKYVNNYGASDIIEIKFLSGEEKMYPFTKDIFPFIKDDFIVCIEPTILE